MNIVGFCCCVCRRVLLGHGKLPMSSWTTSERPCSRLVVRYMCVASSGVVVGGDSMCDDTSRPELL